MARGLTDEPEEETTENLPTVQQLDEAIRELYAYMSHLGSQLEALEDVMAKALAIKEVGSE